MAGMKTGGQIVREQLLALWEVQGIDAEAYERQSSADAIPQKIADIEAGVELLRGDLGLLNQESAERRKEQRELEAQIAEEGHKHEKWKRRLNDVKAPREYQALSREVEMGERQVKEFEETVLAIMSELEDRKKVIDERAANLSDKEQEAAVKVAALKAEGQGLQEEAEKIAKGREKLIAKIPIGLIRKYDRIREQRNGIGVVLTSGICGGCNVQIRPQVLVTLLRFNAIEQCSNCHRLIVHEAILEDPDSAPAEDNAAAPPA